MTAFQALLKAVQVPMDFSSPATRQQAGVGKLTCDDLIKAARIERPDTISAERSRELIADPSWIMQQKVDGMRVLIVFDGNEMRAYNRDRGAIPLPAHVDILRQLGLPFVVDGEAIGGRGHWSNYIVFNVLIMDGRHYQDWSFVQRMNAFINRTADLKIPVVKGFEPVHPLQILGWQDNKNAKELVYGEWRDAVPVIEGVIYRSLGPVKEGKDRTSLCRDVFLKRIEVVGYKWNPAGAGTLKGGSVAAGVFAPQGFIHIANVRSGFTHEQLDFMEAELKAGRRPVFTVEFHGKRTIDLDLVQPRNVAIREDKAEKDCTIAQLYQLLGDRSASTAIRPALNI